MQSTSDTYKICFQCIIRLILFVSQLCNEHIKMNSIVVSINYILRSELCCELILTLSSFFSFIGRTCKLFSTLQQFDPLQIFSSELKRIMLCIVLFLFFTKNKSTTVPFFKFHGLELNFFVRYMENPAHEYNPIASIKDAHRRTINTQSFMEILVQSR